MKRSTFILLLLIPILANALDVPDSDAVIPFSARTGDVLKFGSYNPLSESNSVGETGFNFGTSASLGCDGSISTNAFKSFENNIGRQANYFKNNALGFGINYLAYQSPTLMQIIRFMNNDFSKHYENLIFTCQSMRNMALASRHDQEKQVERQNKCLNSGGDLLDAATGTCIDEEEQKDLSEVYNLAEKAEEDILSEIDLYISSGEGLPDQTGASLSEVQATDIKNRFSRETPDSLALVLRNGMQLNDRQLQATASQLLDSVVYKKVDGKITKRIEKRPKTLEQVLKDKTRFYLDVIDAYVKAIIAKDKEQEQIQREFLEDDKASLPPSPMLVTSLISLHKYNYQSYKTHLKLLSRVMAMSHLKYYTVGTSVVVKNSVSKGILAESGYDLEKETFENSLNVIQGEMTLVKVRDAGLHEQHEVLKSIYIESKKLTSEN